jgi:hypothetical protein
MLTTGRKFASHDTKQRAACGFFKGLFARTKAPVNHGGLEVDAHLFEAATAPRRAIVICCSRVQWLCACALLLVLVATASPVSRAAPQTCEQSAETKLCSRTFYGAGVCDGQDHLPIAEGPWEAVPIEIVGVGVALLHTAPRAPDFQAGYIMAGNSYSPDVMLLHLGEGSETVMFPSGLSFFFPGKPADPPAHIDAHVACSGGGSYQAWLVIYYARVR